VSVIDCRSFRVIVDTIGIAGAFRDDYTSARLARPNEGADEKLKNEFPVADAGESVHKRVSSMHPQIEPQTGLYLAFGPLSVSLNSKNDSDPLVTKNPLLLLLLGLVVIQATPLRCPGSETYTNPIIADGTDPWVAFHDGYYYLTYTTGSGVVIHRSTRLAGTNGLGQAPAVAAFYPPAPYNQDVWAPELHFLQGKAYVYFAADDGNNANHRMFVAQSDIAGPTFSFSVKGKIYDSTTDCWAIDGTVLEAPNGSLYFIWSGWPGSQDGLQNLYIAPMKDPLTIGGPRVLLATPNHTWESWIEEGPEVLQRNGKVFIIYAANLSWTDNECLGMLANSDGNFLNPASWTKSSGPVFSTSVSSGGAVYGPGHCGLTKSLDGTQDVIVYHAAKYSGAGWTRNIRMQTFSWTASGYPNFGQPVPAGVPLPVPSGDSFTPARFNSISPQSNGGVLLAASAPLPMLTNQWSLASSSDLSQWTTLTNIPGLQFSVNLVDGAGETNRFYRIDSNR
jgi:GH43 family beta-xylosidase